MLLLLVSIFFIFAVTTNIVDDVAYAKQFEKKIDYTAMAGKIVIITYFIYVCATAVFLFMLKPVTITLLYIALLALALFLFLTNLFLIIPLVIIMGGALIEFLKRAHYENKKLF